MSLLFISFLRFLKCKHKATFPEKKNITRISLSIWLIFFKHVHNFFTEYKFAFLPLHCNLLSLVENLILFFRFFFAVWPLGHFRYFSLFRSVNPTEIQIKLCIRQRPNQPPAPEGVPNKKRSLVSQRGGEGLERCRILFHEGLRKG